jgi:hypothetical protein
MFELFKLFDIILVFFDAFKIEMAIRDIKVRAKMPTITLLKDFTLA